jgi:CopG family nickel-responsive transcriptional regulator
MVYDHHQRMLEDKLIDIQHNHLGLVCSSMHVHLDSEYCLEILALQGKVGVLKELAGALAALKGVKYSSLSLAPHDKKE